MTQSPGPEIRQNGNTRGRKVKTRELGRTDRDLPAKQDIERSKAQRDGWKIQEGLVELLRVLQTYRTARMVVVRLSAVMETVKAAPPLFPSTEQEVVTCVSNWLLSIEYQFTRALIFRPNTLLQTY